MTTKTGECRHCGKRFPLALHQGRNSHKARTGNERTYQEQLYCSATCRKLASKARRLLKPPTNAVLKATTRLESPEGTKPLSGVTNAMADDFRGWFAVAGPELTPNQFHCAIVGAREAVVGVADVNAAHWKAAKEGKQGYRLPKTDPVIPGMGYDWQPAQSEPESGSKRAIPDDLSIPAFLLRQPPQHLAEAA